MISVTTESVFYFALFMVAIIIFGFLVVAFIYFSEPASVSPKHKHA
jgi:hypothetical protein